MKKQKIKIGTCSSDKEISSREKFFSLFRDCPIPKNEFLSNLGLFTNRQLLSRILFMNELYQKIINVHGIVVEFGVRWGQDLALWESLRGMHEPYNYTRKIVGFDTFKGFPSVDAKDGKSDLASVGAYSVTEDYEKYLKEVLDYHEQESPVSHIKKYQLIKGDATIEIEKYLNDNPETIIAFAYFDFDIYQPTKKCLEAIRGHLTKGSVVEFDNLIDHDFPGGTLALKEVLGLDKYKLMRSPLNPTAAYIIFKNKPDF